MSRLLTNHGRMLLCLASHSGLRIRDLALILGITERSAQKIIGDLVSAGYVSRRRVGRRNHYEIHVEMPLPIATELTVSHMLDAFRLEPDGAESEAEAEAEADVALGS